MRAGAEVDVAAGEADQLGGAQPGLGGEQHQRVVAAADPGAAVGCGEQRVELGFGEERDERALVALGRDRQDALDRGGVLGVPQRGVAEQRADRGQPRVAGADRCCRARARGDPGTRRSAARRDRRCRASLGALAGALGGERRAAAGACRGRRRSCARWRGFWPISRSVKNACSVGASSAHRAPPSRWRSSRSAASASSSGRGLQIPIGRSGVDVPEVGATAADSLDVLDVAAVVAVGVKQRVDRERVAQVMRPRPAGRRARRESGVRDDPLERQMHVAVGQPRPGRRGEHARRSARSGRAGRGGPGRRAAPRSSSRRRRARGTCRTCCRERSARRVGWSMSPRSRRIASPIRIPVTASSPISARIVAARCGVGITHAAAISARISASV